MLIVTLSTGLQFGELEGLTVNNVDLKAGRIVIIQQWNYKEGGGFTPLKNEYK